VLQLALVRSWQDRGGAMSITSIEVVPGQDALASIQDAGKDNGGVGNRNLTVRLISAFLRLWKKCRQRNNNARRQISKRPSREGQDSSAFPMRFCPRCSCRRLRSSLILTY
jgi:hypothetical protein